MPKLFVLFVKTSFSSFAAFSISILHFLFALDQFLTAEQNIYLILHIQYSECRKKNTQQQPVFILESIVSYFLLHTHTAKFMTAGATWQQHIDFKPTDPSGCCR